MPARRRCMKRHRYAGAVLVREAFSDRALPLTMQSHGTPTEKRHHERTKPGTPSLDVAQSVPARSPIDPLLSHDSDRGNASFVPSICTAHRCCRTIQTLKRVFVDSVPRLNCDQGRITTRPQVQFSIELIGAPLISRYDTCPDPSCGARSHGLSQSIDIECRHIISHYLSLSGRYKGRDHNVHPYICPSNTLRVE